MKLKLLMLLIMIFIPIIGIANGDDDYYEDGNDSNSITYRTLVNGYKGFYKVFIEGAVEYPPYENYTLNINVGDEIIWINDDVGDTITIISEDGLWKDSKATLKYTGRQFKYTFNDIGTYTFHIKQNKTLPRQTVIVSNVSTDISPTPTPIVTPTDTVIEPTPEETDTTPTDTVVEPTMTETGIPTAAISDINTTNMKAENIVSANPILVPLNILENFKQIIFAAFMIVIIFLLIK